ncbi:MAG: hypothetical protein ACRDJM_10010, partial [Actinomycetota bacterium]
MRGCRVAFRLATREARRRKGRTLLVSLLIALPVVGIVFGSAMVRSLSPSPAEEARWFYGGADARIAAMGDAATIAGSIDAVERALPAGTNVVGVRSAES